MNNSGCGTCIHLGEKDICPHVKIFSDKGYNVYPNKRFICEMFEYTKEGLWDAMKADYE